jgi:hypothetical protein
MVDLVMLQSVSYVAAAIGVCIAAFYYAMMLAEQRRNMKLTLETRKIGLMDSLVQSLLSEESWSKWFELMNMEWKDYDDFEKRYGSDFNLDNASKRMCLWSQYDAVGNLLKLGLADKETIYGVGTFGATWLWAKFEPVIVENRRRYGPNSQFSGFEYLAKEMMKMANQREPTYMIPETFTKYIADI